TAPLQATPTPPPTAPPPVAPLPFPAPVAPGPAAPLAPPAPGQPPPTIPVGGDLPAGEGPAPATSREVQSEVGPGLGGGPGAVPPPAVTAALLRRPGALGEQDVPGPEAQALLQATQVLDARFDGDDSVRLAEVLLGESTPSAPPLAQAPPCPEAPRLPNSPPTEVLPEGGIRPSEEPAPLPPLVRWLAVPVALAVAAT